MSEKQKEIRFIDAFGGVGGFRLGLERANNRGESDLSERWKENRRSPSDIQFRGDNTRPKTSFTCVAYYEIDKYSIQTYNKNFNENHKAIDITKIKSEDIPDHDLFCGGFPCQSFSIAGKRRGFEDTRGTLFFEIARILRDKKPKMVLLENVKGLLSHDGGKTFATILNTLRELGYVGQYEVLNSKNFGVPQNRERVFIFGFRGKRCPKVFPLGQKCEKVDEQPVSNTLPSSYHKITRGTTMIADFRNDEGLRIRNYFISPTLSTRKSHLILKNIKPCLTPDRPEKRQNGRRFKENGEPMFTLTGQDIHGVSTGSQIRRLTPTECERLQGFPDGWTSSVSDTQRYRQIGNTVTVNVIQAIGERILEAKK